MKNVNVLADLMAEMQRVAAKSSAGRFGCHPTRGPALRARFARRCRPGRVESSEMRCLARLAPAADSMPGPGPFVVMAVGATRG